MPAKDIYHEIVKNALIKEAWTITNDPLSLTLGNRSVYVDLAAEKLLAAEREGIKIAVEIKSFIGKSLMKDLENAMGQYLIYSKILAEQQPERTLYLAINKPAFQEIFTEALGQLLLKTTELKLIIFNSKTEEIVEWIV